ncbi:MAG: 3-deoxy-7-phosphoheptulonate synthase, partial [Bacteroidota bacterium]
MSQPLDLKPIEEWPIDVSFPFIISGPCSAESEQQVLRTARELKKGGHVKLMRGGVWKPRTRPNSFEGIGEPALEWLVKAKEETGMPVTTEVANAYHVDACLKAGIDVLWIGARTTVNPFSVQEIADALKGVDIPVVVKNPINPDLSLWIGA